MRNRFFFPALLGDPERDNQLCTILLAEVVPWFTDEIADLIACTEVFFPLGKRVLSARIVSKISKFAFVTREFAATCKDGGTKTVLMGTYFAIRAAMRGSTRCMHWLADRYYAEDIARNKLRDVASDALYYAYGAKAAVGAHWLISHFPIDTRMDGPWQHVVDAYHLTDDRVCMDDFIRANKSPSKDFDFATLVEACGRDDISVIEAFGERSCSYNNCFSPVSVEGSPLQTSERARRCLIAAFGRAAGKAIQCMLAQWHQVSGGLENYPSDNLMSDALVALCQTENLEVLRGVVDCWRQYHGAAPDLVPMLECAIVQGRERMIAHLSEKMKVKLPHRDAIEMLRAAKKLSAVGRDWLRYNYPDAEDVVQYRRQKKLTADYAYQSVILRLRLPRGPRPRWWEICPTWRQTTLAEWMIWVGAPYRDPVPATKKRTADGKKKDEDITLAECFERAKKRRKITA